MSTATLHKPRRVRCGRGPMSHAGEDCIRCNTVTWGSPYRIVVTARPDRPFLVFWAC